ncbi:MAG: hypothetical protein AAFP77_04840 [Bacteroidota bacterium]
MKRFVTILFLIVGIVATGCECEEPIKVNDLAVTTLRSLSEGLASGNPFRAFCVISNIADAIEDCEEKDDSPETTGLVEFLYSPVYSTNPADYEVISSSYFDIPSIEPGGTPVEAPMSELTGLPGYYMYRVIVNIGSGSYSGEANVNNNERTVIEHFN